jgi:hypothetical protein
VSALVSSVVPALVVEEVLPEPEVRVAEAGLDFEAYYIGTAVVVVAAVAAVSVFVESAPEVVAVLRTVGSVGDIVAVE